MAERFAERGVCWFEEPVSSDDLDGLRLLRDRAPAGMEIAAGEYGYDLPYFRRMLDAGAVDVLQADATRCGGITGFLRVGALCDGAGIAAVGALRADVAPARSAAPARRCGTWNTSTTTTGSSTMLFDGAPEPRDGLLRPDLSRPGLGLEFKRQDAARFAVSLDREARIHDTRRLRGPMAGSIELKSGLHTRRCTATRTGRRRT